MAKKMTKAQMEAFKKKNFNLNIKVTEAQLDKLRKEGTPEKAIAKYKNDPSMREALNRFYGKDRVGKTPASTSTTGTVRGGPGPKMPKRPAGGPGAKMTARDGRGAKSSTAKPTSNKPGSSKKMASTMIPGRKEALAKMTPEQRRRNDQLAKFGKDVILPLSMAAIPVGGVAGGLAAAGAKSAGAKLVIKQTAAKNVAARATTKADEAIKLQKAATAAKNAAKTGKGSGAGSSARAAKLQREAAAAKKAADALAKQARSANARAKTLGSPKNSAKTGPKVKSTTAKPKSTSSGNTSKQADDVLRNAAMVARRNKGKIALGTTAAYLARPRRDEKR
jgi:hypothetical protein